VISTTAVVVSGCAGPLSSLDPGGPAARSIATLWWVMLIAAVVIFALVMALLALAWRPGREPAAQAGTERVWVIGLGLAFPVAVLLSLLAYGLWLGERLLPRDGTVVARVQAEAKRWSWTFSYDDAPGRSTQGVLHIPAGRPVDVAITTGDVIHSFWVPRLAGKLDAIPGHVNVLRIEADEPGIFAGRSSEFSGPGYDGHVFTVVAHGPESWLAFLEAGE
jgi:cytochrome c oxidase subunit 2/cytochrome aa3-600 menaquinol oxidase subunit 2